MSYAILALVTNRAKRTFQICHRLGYAEQVTHFCCGANGHDPDSFMSSLTPDPSYDPDPDHDGHRVPANITVAVTAIASAVDDPYFATIWTCLLAEGVGTGPLSSVYLLAQMVCPIVNPTPAQLAAYEAALAAAGLMAVGKLWVWAYANMPLSVKTDTESRSLPVAVVY